MLSPRRAFAVAALLATLLAGLGFRLHRLQLRQGPALAAAALTQRAQALPSLDGRGDILDRNGLPLTDPRVSWSAIAFPALLRTPGALGRAAGALGLDPAALALALGRGEPAAVKSDLSHDEVERLRSAPVPGVAVQRRVVRRGPAVQAGHLIGVLRDADGAPLTGLELQYDAWLRPSRQRAIAVLVDARGRLLAGAGTRELAGGEGRPLMLTIDARWQAAVEGALRRHGDPSAAVVIEPRQGDVLAMASWPALPDDWLNRAISAYPTGSVFKPIVAAAAWEEGLDRLGPLPDPDRGPLDPHTALAVSSNPAFQALGQRLGGERLLAYARRFGFGRSTELGLPAEATGNLPEPWALRVGDLAQLSIGQGPLTATPLQLARAFAIIANNGLSVPLRVVREPAAESRTSPAPPATTAPAPGATAIAPTAPATLAPAPARVISAATARMVQLALRAVTDEGTGQEARVPGISVAGKTGTAEAYDGDAGRWISHAWFVGYAPAESPRVVVAVFAQRGVSGGLTAAPLFADIVAAGFGLDGVASRR